MIRGSNALLARPILRYRNRHWWGAPGAPIITTRTLNVTKKFRSTDLVVQYTHCRPGNDKRLLQYLGKHAPHPQKSLWSADTPVLQDRHLFMLTTFDVDMFKYWFGVRRARLSYPAWKIIAHSSLLPPPYKGKDNTLLPRPIFNKEELYAYYLANRRPLETTEKEDYLLYQNSMIKTPEQRKAEAPKPPYL